MRPGAKEDEHIGSDVGDDNVDAPQEPPPEAVEAEELQFGKNKKKKRAQESDSQMQVRCVPVDKKVVAAGNTLSCAGSWSYAGSWTQGWQLDAGFIRFL